MIRKEEVYSPQDIIPLLVDAFNNGIETINIDGDVIRTKSERYRVFDKSFKCSHCDIVGTRLYKEKTNEDHNLYHFNLYGIDENDQEVLMTKDHIVPKSKGGRNSLDNYDTMCTICNKNKSNIVGSLTPKLLLDVAKMIDDEQKKKLLIKGSSTLNNLQQVMDCLKFLDRYFTNRCKEGKNEFRPLLKKTRNALQKSNKI